MRWRQDSDFPGETKSLDSRKEGVRKKRKIRLMGLLCNVVSPPLLPLLVDREAFIVYSQAKTKTLKQTKMHREFFFE